MSNVDCTCGHGDGSGFSLCSKCYPSRTVRGMYQQEQQIAKAEDAGLIVTAADLIEQNCKLCGDKLYLINDELLCPNCDQDVLE